ncbi:MAG: hypothetical protein IJW21_06450 [Clostridia bacterium]|nr:hypothetical protein [Clostridia bacterium]
MSNFIEILDVISNNPDVMSVLLFIWSIILGIIIALFISFYNRKVIGSFFRALVANEAFDEESAKTLDEIHQRENDSVISKLEKNGMYRDIVTIIDENGEEAPRSGRIVITADTKFYISEERRNQVRNQWGETNENVLVLIAGVVGMVILGLLLTVIFVSGKSGL